MRLFSLSSTSSAVCAALAFLAVITTGCGAGVRPVTPHPRAAAHSDAIQLLDGPVHLGDGRAGGQAFSHGAPSAARVCSLVTMPRSSDAYLQVRNLRQRQTLANVLRVNNVSYPLRITLERDARELTSNAMAASPVQRVRLEQGPSMICLVAGVKTGGDVDDFEVEGLTLFVEVREVFVRGGMTDGASVGMMPPAVPWGVQQMQGCRPAAAGVAGAAGGLAVGAVAASSQHRAGGTEAGRADSRARHRESAPALPVPDRRLHDVRAGVSHQPAVALREGAESRGLASRSNSTSSMPWTSCSSRRSNRSIPALRCRGDLWSVRATSINSGPVE
jgi:hypothetical protein